MPDPTLTTLAVATGGAFLGKFVGPAAEAIGKAAWEQAQQLGAKATAYLAAVGREPQPVEPKLLLPLVQAASLETDPTLAELWAALLANASDPAQRITVQVGFIDVLRQLQPTDTIVLKRLYFYPSTEGEKMSSTQGLVDSNVFEILGYHNGRLALDNLVRLRLCREGQVAMDGAQYPFWSTEYGFRFMQAVTLPTP